MFYIWRLDESSSEICQGTYRAKRNAPLSGAPKRLNQKINSVALSERIFRFVQRYAFEPCLRAEL